MKHLCFLLLEVVFFHFLQAQGNNQAISLEVGKPCPEFTIRNIKYYSKSEVNIKDFHGKWVVLDFWERACGLCISSFSHVSRLQQEFGERVQFLMVGLEDKENLIRPLYDKFKKLEHLEMPSAFDSVLIDSLELYAFPYVIVIDEEGVIRGLTTGISTNDLKDLMAGRHPSLKKAFRNGESDQSKLPYDWKKPFLINDNGGHDTDFLYRSVLTEAKPYMSMSATDIFGEYDIEKGKFETIGNYFILYNQAFWGTRNLFWPDDSLYGKVWPSPILATADSSIIFNGKESKYFCYSLIVPPPRSSRKFLMRCMQKDLENYFGYDVRIEKRKMPCWRLVALDTARNVLKTKGGTEVFKTMKGAGLLMHNCPMQKLINEIAGQLTNIDFILFDDTGIKGNIDIDLSDCLLSDRDSLEKYLRPNGLDLVKGEREMYVLVLRDLNL